MLLAPTLALALASQTVAQLTAVAAGLEAQEVALQNDKPLACAVVDSTSTVRVGQQMALAWGSVGALDPLTSSSSIPMWAPNGVSILSFARTGTWTYDFTFYNAQNATTTCEAKILVTK